MAKLSTDVSTAVDRSVDNFPRDLQFLTGSAGSSTDDRWGDHPPRCEFGEYPWWRRGSQERENPRCGRLHLHLSTSNIPGERWFFHYLPGRRMMKTETKSVSVSFRDSFEFFAIRPQAGSVW